MEVVTRARKQALVYRARFLASTWISSAVASWDCWDGYTDKEVNVMVKELEKLARALLKRAPVPADGDHGLQLNESEGA